VKASITNEAKSNTNIVISGGFIVCLQLSGSVFFLQSLSTYVNSEITIERIARSNRMKTVVFVI
jgi:hypothetical protein